MTDSGSSLPPGFRFHPTDEELILHYLRNKTASTPYLSIIAQVDIYKFDPWELPAKATFGENEWYFFSPRDRKYPNGARPNRSAASGYWKATGTDKPILASTVGKERIGVKKALVFYKGRPPKGIKTNWIMHEYRLAEAPKNKPIMKLKDSSMRLDDWVLYRIYTKSNSLSSTTMRIDQEHEDPLIQDVLLPIATLPNLPSQNTLMSQNSSSFSNLFDAMDYAILAQFLSDNQSDPAGFEPDLDQPIFNSCTKNSSSSNRSSNYLLQNLPQMDSTVSIMENQLKRQHPMTVNSDGGTLHPSKKLINSCFFTNGTNQLEIPISTTASTRSYVLSSELQFQR